MKYYLERIAVWLATDDHAFEVCLLVCTPIFVFACAGILEWRLSQ